VIFMIREQLTDHFCRSEFECPCCGKDNVSLRLVQALEKLRELCGDQPIHVNSGVRCVEWNHMIGGVPTSQHIMGRAADIVVRSHEPIEVAEKAEKVAEFRHGGIGVYDTVVHVDVRMDGPARWEG